MSIFGSVKNICSKVIGKAKQAGTALAVAASVAVGSALTVPGVSHAADHQAAINSAFGDANGNVTAAVLAVIALAAIVTGLTMIVGLLKR